MINDLLRFCYEKGWSDAIYDSNLIITLAAHVIFLLLYRKKYNISLRQSIVAIVLIYPIAYVLMLTLAWIESGFQYWGAINYVRICVYIPLIAFGVAKLVRLPFGRIVDYLAPSMALQKALGHLVCPFVGCCHGYACSWGIWNPIKDVRVFPNQWLESFVAFAIVWYLLRLAKKEKYTGRGKVYITFLLIYGSTRFLLEFLRDNDKLLLGVSNLALHALFMVFVGAIWLMVLHEMNKRQELLSKKKLRH